MRCCGSALYPGSDIPPSIKEVRSCEHKFKGVSKEDYGIEVAIIIKGAFASMNIMISAIHGLVSHQLKFWKLIVDAFDYQLHSMSNLQFKRATSNSS